MLKALISGGHFDKEAKKIVPVEPPLNFASALYPHVQTHILEWAIGSSSFVILALLEASHFPEKTEVTKVLSKNITVLEKAAKEETVEQKGRRKLAEAETDDNGSSKRRKLKLAKEKVVGNRGTALLLQMLC